MVMNIQTNNNKKKMLVIQSSKSYAKLSTYNKQNAVKKKIVILSIFYSQ